MDNPRKGIERSGESGVPDGQGAVDIEIMRERANGIPGLLITVPQWLPPALPES